MVRGLLSEHYLTRKFIARNICNAKYSRITVHSSSIVTNKISNVWHVIKVLSDDGCESMEEGSKIHSTDSEGDISSLII